MSAVDSSCPACNEALIIYVQVSSIVVPLLRFYFHEEVRIGAVQILCELLRSADLAAEKGLHGATKANTKQLLDYIWPALMEAISKVADCIFP